MKQTATARRVGIDPQISARPFRLEDCADDIVDVADALGVQRLIAVGYSMGGPVALLARRRHHDRVAGLVLCTSATRFTTLRPGRAAIGGLLASSTRSAPAALRQHPSRQAVTLVGREFAMSSAIVKAAMASASSMPVRGVASSPVPRQAS